MEELRNIIVIGASAGGISAVSNVIKDFSVEMDAAVVVVLHVSAKSNTAIIAGNFQKNTTFNCLEASNGMTIKKGHLYVAPPEQQLMIEGSNLKLSAGSLGNKNRPSINILFQSAADNFGSRTIGIILTGMLDDGTAGMLAIEREGGICIVQDPLEALFSDMPENVLSKIDVDHRARLKEIPEIVNQILNRPIPSSAGAANGTRQSREEID